MRGYSNFGNAGLIQSAIFLAVVFLVMNLLFKNTGIEMKLTLNLFPVFLLSSGSLTTILFSGGWCLVMVLYWLFKKEFDEKNE
jgi:archaellum biogenesis protein FlaJ (TadC family)